MRCRWAGAVVLAATMILGLTTPAPAGAHSYGGSYTWRLYDCGMSGKYACQAHYLLSVDSPLYGPLWQVKHSHGCTTKDPIDDNWQYWEFRIHDHNHSQVWAASGHENAAHSHTSQWCGWSVGTHEFYPNVYVPRGDNAFELRTASHQAGTDPLKYYPARSYWANA